MNAALERQEASLSAIRSFLPCATPDAWVECALLPENRATLLVDHANCEKKAAATALSLMHRYIHNTALLEKMSRLAREELRHFEQVLKIMRMQSVEYVPLTASRYAQALHKSARRHEPGRLVDTLIIGALIEARSCERFASLAPHLDRELGEFYLSLLKSEARHFSDYLQLAESLSEEADFQSRLNQFLELEADLVTTADTEFRFHSGVPR